jgi:hypothetical protein
MSARCTSRRARTRQRWGAWGECLAPRRKERTASCPSRGADVLSPELAVATKGIEVPMRAAVLRLRVESHTRRGAARSRLGVVCQAS